MDSFDILAEKAREASRPPEKEQPAKQSAEEWREAFCRLATGRWCRFDHPTHGRVAGKVEKCVWRGLTRRGGIEDFTLTIADGKGKTVEVSLVESMAAVGLSKQEALEESK